MNTRTFVLFFAFATLTGACVQTAGTAEETPHFLGYMNGCLVEGVEACDDTLDCYAGVCVAACEEDADCLDGASCHANFCYWECETDADCKASGESMQCMTFNEYATTFNGCFDPRNFTSDK